MKLLKVKCLKRIKRIRYTVNMDIPVKNGISFRKDIFSFSKLKFIKLNIITPIAQTTPLKLEIHKQAKAIETDILPFLKYY